MSACLRPLALLLSLASVPGRAAPPEVPADAVVLPVAGRGGGRTAVPADPVLAAIVAGAWKAPKPGDTVQSPGGPARTWAAAPVKNGTVTHPGTPGYVYLPVKSDGDRVITLHAVGHSMVYVNGEPRAGDVYGTGYVRLPIALRDGVNDLLFVGGRGPVTVKLLEPKAAAELDPGDLTTPDFRVGVPVETVAALVVRNNTTATAAGLTIETTVPGGGPVRTPVPPLPPLSARKVGFRLAAPAPDKEGPVTVAVRLLADGKQLDAAELGLKAVHPAATHKRTFVSGIDGSVQYFALVPAKPGEPGAKPGLVLTLHGAGVEAIGQAACYAPKPGLHVVAPTNRRPFGFDWEDWGRLDALEVLDLAATDLGTDPARTYLTGHSMGGHGTWHLGVTFPGRFAAIAPSAGWVSMASYAGVRRDAAPAPERELIQRATNPGDTLALVRNLAPTGVYVLHGDADDNVPVGQARTMRKELAEFHRDFAYYEQPGAGHWWGNACVDWPPAFEFLGRHALPGRAAVRKVAFRTASPRVSADCHWLTIAAQAKPFAFSSAALTCDPDKRTVAGTTENVARLALDLRHLPAGKPVRVTLDGQTLETPGGRMWFARDGKTWAVAAEPSADVKGPHRAGPFKDAFRNRVAFVYGTTGTPAETAWARAKARFDAETFWYRGNGSIDVIPDTSFDPAADPDRNVVVYGHAGMNAAWGPLLGGSPVRVAAGAVRVGDREESGDGFGLLLVRPRPGSGRAVVAAVAGSGPQGLRRTDRLPYFSSGVGYPDWLVLDAGGVAGAGYFGNDWGVASGEAAWRAK